MCVLDGSATLQDWMIWEKHPVQKQYDVIMDLGASLTALAVPVCCPSLPADPPSASPL